MELTSIEYSAEIQLSASVSFSTSPRVQQNRAAVWYEDVPNTAICKKTNKATDWFCRCPGKAAYSVVYTEVRPSGNSEHTDEVVVGQADESLGTCIHVL